MFKTARYLSCFEQLWNFVWVQLYLYYHDLGVYDYKRGMDRWIHLLTTCAHHSELHFTDHWHTQTSVLSLLQSPLAVSLQRLLPRESLQLSALRPSSHNRQVEFLLTDNSTNWVPDWRQFHTSLTGWLWTEQLTTELSHSPTSYFTSLQPTELLTTPPSWLASSLCNLAAT
jgi:hypothetical protein